MGGGRRGRHAAEVRDVPGGFSPGATAVLACPRRAVFVKAVGADLNPDAPDFHRQEAAVSAALPGPRRLPRLLDSYDDGDWVALAFVAVDGRAPAHPWDPVELHAAIDALSELHAAPDPEPGRRGPSAADRPAGLFGGWGAMAGRPGPDGVDPWARRNLDALADLEARWPEAVAGTTLLHSDVRSDNLLLTPDGVVFVDWPHACVGAPVFDAVAWAPSVVLEGGPEPEALLARHGPSAGPIPAPSPRWWRRSAGSSCRTRCDRHRLGSPRCVAFRPPRAMWRCAGSSGSPGGDRPCATRSAARFRTMRFGLQIPNFPTTIPPVRSSTAWCSWPSPPRSRASTRCG